MKVWATLFILLWTSITNAEGVGAIRSSLEAMESYKAVQKDGYDLRVDTDSDGAVDIQSIRKGKDEVTLAGKQFQINSYENGNVKVVTGVIEKGRPQITSVTEGKMLSNAKAEKVEMSYEDICKSITESTNRMGQTASDFSTGQLENKISSYFDDKCAEMDVEIQSYGAELIKLIKVDKARSNGTLRCMQNRANEAFGLYRAGKIGKEQMLSYQLTLAKVKSDIADFYEGRADLPIISCEEGQESSASLTNDGKITIKNGSDGKSADIQAALLQKWGIVDKPSEFLEGCKDPKPIVTIVDSDMNRNKGVGGGAILTQPAMAASTTKFSAEKVAAVNKDLAQTKVTIPSATEASPKALAKIEATQGTAAVQQVMRQQSSGILNMTNAVMAAVNTQAVAGTKTATRSVASTGSGSGSGSSSSKSSYISGLKKTTIGKNEQVVEEILLDEPRASAKTRTVANAAAQGTRSAVSAAAGNARNPANADEVTGGSGELAGGTGGGGGSTGGAGRGSSFSPSSGGTKNKNNSAAVNGQGRSPASASSSSTSDEVSGDELVSYIKNGEYDPIKKQIKDKDLKLRNRLIKNSITIVDPAGNAFGAAEGKVIFMDKGNRFEKQ